jgi:hypothetical protein
VLDGVQAEIGLDTLVVAFIEKRYRPVSVILQKFEPRPIPNFNRAIGAMLT